MSQRNTVQRIFYTSEDLDLMTLEVLCNSKGKEKFTLKYDNLLEGHPLYYIDTIVSYLI